MSIFTIVGKTVTPAGKVDFGKPKAGPSATAFAPDGKTALVTRDGDHKISILSVDGTKVEDTKRMLPAASARTRCRSAPRATSPWSETRAVAPATSTR